MTTPNAAHSGTVSIAKDLTVNRLGFGAMRITGEGIWGDPKDPAECKRVLHRLLDLNSTSLIPLTRMVLKSVRT